MQLLCDKLDDKIAFPLAIQSGVYGYKTTNGTFVAFRSASTGTYTFASDSTGSTVDLGAYNTYRYINATNVYNKGKADGSGIIIPSGKYLYLYGAGQGAACAEYRDLPITAATKMNIGTSGCLIDIKTNNLTTLYFQRAYSNADTSRGVTLIKGTTITPFYTYKSGNNFDAISLEDYDCIAINCSASPQYGTNFYVN